MKVTLYNVGYIGQRCKTAVETNKAIERGKEGKGGGGISEFLNRIGQSRCRVGGPCVIPILLFGLLVRLFAIGRIG